MAKQKSESSEYVKLAGAICGIFLVITIFFLALAPTQLVHLNSIVWAFAVLGIVLGGLIYKTKK